MYNIAKVHVLILVLILIVQVMIINLSVISSSEHLDFMSTMDIDLDINPFEQLQHASIGYQSLTDVPTAITYSEDSMSFKVN